ncbi:WYL domain-containing protein [Fusibacter sp. JL298sf-3]
MDEINKAIQKNKQIRFKYFMYNLDKEVEYRRNGDWYYASPYAFTWDDDNYYMIAYYEKYEDISNFRVDRMTSIESLMQIESSQVIRRISMSLSIPKRCLVGTQKESSCRLTMH